MRVSITLDEQQVEKIRALGTGVSVAEFVRHAVRVALADAPDWEKMLDEALEATGGPMTKEEIAWADELLGVGKRKRSRRSPI